MDIIQRTVSLFDRVVQKIKDVGSVLASSLLTSSIENDSIQNIFWIFGW